MEGGRYGIDLHTAHGVISTRDSMNDSMGYRVGDSMGDTVPGGNGDMRVPSLGTSRGAWETRGGKGEEDGLNGGRIERAIGIGMPTDGIIGRQVGGAVNCQSLRVLHGPSNGGSADLRGGDEGRSPASMDAVMIGVHSKAAPGGSGYVGAAASSGIDVLSSGSRSGAVGAENGGEDSEEDGGGRRLSGKSVNCRRSNAGGSKTLRAGVDCRMGRREEGTSNGRGLGSGTSAEVRRLRRRMIGGGSRMRHRSLISLSGNASAGGGGANTTNNGTADSGTGRSSSSSSSKLPTSTRSSSTGSLRNMTDSAPALATASAPGTKQTTFIPPPQLPQANLSHPPLPARGPSLSPAAVSTPPPPYSSYSHPLALFIGMGVTGAGFLFAVLIAICALCCSRGQRGKGKGRGARKVQPLEEQDSPAWDIESAMGSKKPPSFDSLGQLPREAPSGERAGVGGARMARGSLDATATDVGLEMRSEDLGEPSGWQNEPTNSLECPELVPRLEAIPSGKALVRSTDSGRLVFGDAEGEGREGCGTPEDKKKKKEREKQGMYGQGM